MNRRLIGNLVGTGHNTWRQALVRAFAPSLTEGRDERQEMKAAVLLVVEEKPDGIFLYRYAADGSYAGDTWHTDIDEAKQQASFEYPDVPIGIGMMYQMTLTM